MTMLSDHKPLRSPISKGNIRGRDPPRWTLSMHGIREGELEGEMRMATLSVLKFNDPSGADRVLIALQGLQEREIITLEDAAVVSWPQGNKKPTTRQLHGTAGAGALGGAFWGFLFGLIFFVPFLGAAIGAGMGALTGSMADVGIDDDFVKQVREKVTEGTSALFALDQRGDGA